MKASKVMAHGSKLSKPRRFGWCGVFLAVLSFAACGRKTLHLLADRNAQAADAAADAAAGSTAGSGGSGGEAGSGPGGSAGQGGTAGNVDAGSDAGGAQDAGFPCDPKESWCPYCNDSSDCKSDKPYCGPEHLCVKCLSRDNCPLVLPVCNPRGECVSCVSNADCPSGLLCDMTLGTCVGCVDSGDCSPGLHCNERHDCVPCVNDGHCDLGYRCDLRTYTCQPRCDEHWDCQPLYLCNLELGICDHCSNSVQCIDAYERPGMLCLTERICAECDTDANCYPSRPVCDAPFSRLCRECLDNVHCPPGWVCDRSIYECVPF